MKLTMIDKIKYALMIFVTPDCWLRNYSYSDYADLFINSSLDAGHVLKIKSRYSAELNGKELWIGNYPYAYGSIGLFDGLPSRRTVFRLKAAERKALKNMWLA